MKPGSRRWLILLATSFAAVPASAQSPLFEFLDLSQVEKSEIEVREVDFETPPVRESEIFLSPRNAPPSPDRSLGRPLSRTGLDARGFRSLPAVTFGRRTDVPLPGLEMTIGGFAVRMLVIESKTDRDFDALLEWLEEAQLDRVGCFRYEPVTGAAANALPDAVPPELTEERWHRLMQTQQAISAERLRQKVGREIEVIVDEATEERVVARSPGDAPEIDGKVFLPPATEAQAGDVLTVLIEDADAYDLWARAVNR